MLSRLILCLVLLLSSAFAQLELIKNVRVGARPHGLYVEGEDIYVSLPEEDSIAVVNNYMVGTNVTLIPIGGCGPVDMVRNPGGEGEGEGEREGAGSGVRKASLFFISCTNKDSILSIDLSSGQTLGSWIVGSEPSLFANRVVSGVAYIPTVSSNLLTGFDLASSSFTRSYRTGDGPQVAEVARLGRMAYVSNNLAHTVSMINLVDGLATVVGLPSGSSPQGVGLDETEDVLVVAGSGLDQVYLLNLTSASIQQTIESVGPTPYSVAISPSGKYAFVTNFGSNTISIIDVLNSKVVDQITSGQQPILARVFSSRLFVSNFASGTISIFDIVE